MLDKLTEPPDGIMTFSDGKTISGRAWIVTCGPVVRPDRPIPMRGFRGFRYVKTLF